MTQEPEARSQELGARSRDTTGPRLAWNTLLNLGTGGVLLLLNLLFVPLMLRAFGAELYGVLTVTWMVLAHLGWLDLGFSRASAKFVAQELARDRADDASLWSWTALLTQTLLGVGGALLLWGLAPWLVSLLHTQPGRRGLVVLTLRLFAFSLPLDLAARSLTGVLQARQRFGWINTLSLFGTLGTYAAYSVGMLRGSDFRAVIYALCALRVLNLVATYAAATRALPEIGRVGPRRAMGPAYRSRARTMFRFGGWVTIAAAIGPLLLYLDQWLVSSFRGVASLPYYAVPFSLLTRLAVFPSSLTATLFPAFSALEARTEWDRVESYFLRSHRYLILALTPLLFLLFVWAHEIFRLWIGVEFAARATLPLRILILGFGIALVAPLSGALLEAAGRPDLLAKLYLVELPLNLLAVFLLTRAYGIVGAAASYTLRAFLETLALWIVLYRVLPLSWRSFAREILLPGAILVGLLGGVAGCLRGARIGSPVCTVGTLLTLAVYGASALRFLLDDRDRRFLGALRGRRAEGSPVEASP